MDYVLITKCCNINGNAVHQGEVYKFIGSYMGLVPSTEVDGVFVPNIIYSFSYQTGKDSVELSVPFHSAIVIDIQTVNFDELFKQFQIHSCMDHCLEHYSYESLNRQSIFPFIQ